MGDSIRPTSAETRYLSLGYNRFYDLYEEINDKNFWNLDPKVRFSKVKDIFSVYTELIKYEPLQIIISTDSRPHAELLAMNFIKFLRNVLQHFPFYDEWDEVYIDKELVNAIEAPGSVDKFLSNSHPYDTKFRIWNPIEKEMAYVSINLNTGYLKGSAVFLSEMLNEKDGVTLLCVIMRKYLDTQVEVEP